MQEGPTLRITKYEMRVAQKRPLLSLELKTSNKQEFFFQVDVQRSLVNLTLFLVTKALDNRLEHSLQILAKKKTDKTKIGRDVFVPMDLFEETCKLLRKQLPDYDQLTEGIEMVKAEISSRTKFLEREELKRTNSRGKPSEEAKSKLEKFQKKFSYLLNAEYDFSTEETFDDLYQKVRKSEELVPRHSSFVQIKFSDLKKKYARQYQLLSKMPGMSRPTNKSVEKGLTSLYVMRTDLQVSIKGQYYNVVKVGKTNQSIFNYERGLYEDYKCKILFEYVYLGIFYEEPGKVIDHYFHDRLIRIPNSKYFIFNYTDFEDNIRVSQQFYLMTEEFLVAMQELLTNYCEAHRQPISAK